MIATILLLPAETDRALLAPGVAGARVPTMDRCSCGVWYAPSGFLGRRKHEAHRAPGGPDMSSLVLALDGKAVPEGCDRAARWCRDVRPNAARKPAVLTIWRLPNVLDLADYCAMAGARVILLGADGLEVSP